MGLGSMRPCIINPALRLKRFRRGKHDRGR